MKVRNEAADISDFHPVGPEVNRALGTGSGDLTLLLWVTAPEWDAPVAVQANGRGQGTR